jgi:hypothetical protein
MTPSELRQIADLLDRKEKLLQELAEVETALRGTGWKEDGHTTGRAGYLKQQIISLIQSAGSTGITIDQLAEALQREKQRINVWYHMTGKKIPNIQRVGSNLVWRD